MNEFNINELKKLYIPPTNSIKGDNGKVMIIAGSILFHAASLWPLEIASRLTDMVFFSSVNTNNDIVQKDKESFKNGIVIERKNLEKYIQEADCILIGPGLPRDDGRDLQEENTGDLTKRLLTKYPHKKWVVDGGSLQVIEPQILPKTAIITPNVKEFKKLFGIEPTLNNARLVAGKYNITVLLKGEADFVCNESQSVVVRGGNAGMTKGGTGDVLAGLVASLYCKNDAFLSAESASFINKEAANALYKEQGLYYNASDLVIQITKIMKNFIL